jgi:hypothetical protein
MGFLGPVGCIGLDVDILSLSSDLRKVSRSTEPEIYVQRMCNLSITTWNFYIQSTIMMQIMCRIVMNQELK